MFMCSAEYNDEDPGTGREEFYHAHSKGVLMLGCKHASWLQHSVPAFPHQRAFYPHAQSVYGQHFACFQVTLLFHLCCSCLLRVAE